MLSKTTLALAAAIVFGTAFTASAAPRHHYRTDRDYRGLYNVVPDPGIITDSCAGSVGPCRTRPDGW